jgi:hypothetical protein
LFEVFDFLDVGVKTADLHLVRFIVAFKLAQLGVSDLDPTAEVGYFIRDQGQLACLAD